MISEISLLFVIVITAKSLTATRDLEDDKKVREAIDTTKIFQLEEISVTATRYESSVFNLGNNVLVINPLQIQKKNLSLTPDALNDFSSVFVQKTNYGGGSPIIRGLIGNNILILVNGIRLNNSTYRYGPNQYLNTIDPSLVDKIEVVHGPNSVLYGSDALGGVINIITKDAENIPDGINSFTRIATADYSFYQNLNYKFSFSNTDVLLSGTYKNFRDLDAGGNYSTQSFTGYNGYDGFINVNHNFNESNKLSLSFQLTNFNDVPRTDRMLARSDLEYYYDPQLRELFLANYKIMDMLPFISSSSTSISFNRQKEGRKIISAKSPEIELKEMDDVKTIGIQSECYSILSKNNFLVYGIDYYRDFIASERVQINNVTQEQQVLKPQFSNGSEYDMLGIFTQGQFVINPVSFTAGIRWSSFGFNGYLDSLFGKITSRKSDFTFSSNIVLNVIPERLNISAGYSQGFRAPNIDDITVLGRAGSGSGARYDTPNTQLDAEKSYNYEAAVKFRIKDFESSIFFYHSDLNNLISPKLSSYYGQDSLEGFPVYTRMNIGEAYINGIEFFLQWRLTYDLLFTTNTTWTYGQNISANEPLSRIPPMNGYGGLSWTYSNFFIEYYILWALEQERLSTRDKLDYRIGSSGTPGFLTDNTRMRYALLSNISIIITLENILDTLYKYHSSGVYAPGRNFILSISANI